MWCAEHGVTLSGGRGLAGAAFNDAAIVDLAHFDAGRLILQRAAHEMDARWLSDFLLLDGRTINVGAVGSFVKHHSKVKAILRRELCETGNLTATSRHIPRYLGNEVAPGDVIFVEGDGGVELAEVTSVSGIDVRVTLLDRARTEVPAAVGGLVFVRRDTSADWQPGVITGLGSRHVAVRRPSGVEDDRIPTRRDCLRTFIAEWGETPNGTG